MKRKEIENCQKGHGLLSIFFFLYRFEDARINLQKKKKTIKQYKLIREEIELGGSKHLAHLFGMTLLGKVELGVS